MQSTTSTDHHGSSGVQPKAKRSFISSTSLRFPLPPQSIVTRAGGTVLVCCPVVPSMSGDALEIMLKSNKYPRLVHNRYLYYFEKSCTRHYRWKCIRAYSLKCRAVLRTNTDIKNLVYIAFNHEHNHENDKVAIYDLKMKISAPHSSSTYQSLGNTAKEDGNTSKQNNISIDDEPDKKKQKFDKNEISILKSKFREEKTNQFKSKVESSIKPNKEIASTSNEEVPMVIDFAESTESENSSAENVKSIISVMNKDREMMNKYNYELSSKYDSRYAVPGVTDRMPLYFLKTENSLEYFKAVINAVTSDSNEDLSLLMENATFQCYYDSDVTDPVDSST